MEEKTFSLLNKTFLLVAVLVVGILIFFVGQIILQNRSINLQNQNQITVSGQGKIYVKPDIASVSLGAKTRGLTVADVTKKNTDIMNAVIDGIKKLGVDEKDIQTTNYNLYPDYNYTESRGRIFEGYILDQNIQVKIRDFSKIGEILAAGTSKGASLVGELQFTIENPEKVKQEARAKAIAQAKENAKNLAKESGVKLGKIINIYENYYPYYSSKAAGLEMSMADSAPMPTIEPGQQEINITINLTYQVK